MPRDRREGGEGAGEEARRRAGAPRLILRVSREDVEEFVRSLREPLGGEKAAGIARELRDAIRQVSDLIDELSQEIIRPHTSPTAMIVPPFAYQRVFMAKAADALDIAAGIVQRQAGEIRRRLEEEEWDPARLRKAGDMVLDLLDSAISLHVALHVTLQKILALVAVNAPARVRPPLANLNIGFDVIE